MELLVAFLLCVIGTHCTAFDYNSEATGHNDAGNALPSENDSYEYGSDNTGYVSDNDNHDYHDGNSDTGTDLGHDEHDNTYSDTPVYANPDHGHNYEGSPPDNSEGSPSTYWHETANSEEPSEDVESEYSEDPVVPADPAESVVPHEDIFNPFRHTENPRHFDHASTNNDATEEATYPDANPDHPYEEATNSEANPDHPYEEATNSGATSEETTNSGATSEEATYDGQDEATSGEATGTAEPSYGDSHDAPEATEPVNAGYPYNIFPGYQQQQQRPLYP